MVNNIFQKIYHTKTCILFMDAENMQMFYIEQS
jgi:hypothetical protein